MDLNELMKAMGDFANKGARGIDAVLAEARKQGALEEAQVWLESAEQVEHVLSKTDVDAAHYLEHYVPNMSDREWLSFESLMEIRSKFNRDARVRLLEARQVRGNTQKMLSD
jgi:hypothetical protein